MSQQVTISASRGTLASYGLPSISYSHQSLAPPLRSIWKALAEQDAAEAIRTIDRHASADDDRHHAAFIAARAGAALQINDLASAEKWGRRSLELCPDQWMSARILTQVLTARRLYKRAYRQLASIAPDAETPSWDAPLNGDEHAMAMAVLAWRSQRWSEAVDHILAAFPDGPSAMPTPLQRDVLRLSLSADRPRVAGAAAGHIIETCDDREADAVLQTLVHKEWLDEALALYQQLAERSPATPWIYRRVIGLCLRVGAVEEARTVRAQLQHS